MGIGGSRGAPVAPTRPLASQGEECVEGGMVRAK